MATGGEQVTAAAAGEETPLRKTEQGADNAELSAPSGWTKKV
jgi:alpha-D-ribose 1-methylphosphonate 5-phosphate C-P lyase